MLYLNPPYHQIDGVFLMPDHLDPLQFYYMPMEPHLTTIEDPSTGQKIPSIQVIRFTGEDDEGSEFSGGFLDFDCNIGIDTDKLAAVADGLRAAAGLRDAPKLAPVPLIDGSVRMMLFGEESQDDAPVGPLGKPKKVTDDDKEFVLKISHHAKPSLYGANQAAFSVRLDQEGVTILKAALQGELSPIGVIYSLEYVGLRPAYKVHVEADWNRVQHHIETSEKVNVPIFASSSVDEVVDELIEDQAITITSDLMVVESDDESGATGRYEQALEQVREAVFDTFFTPSLEPMPTQAGDTIDDMGRVLRTIATSGFATSFWEKKTVDLTRIDRKKLNIDFSERTSVIREIHPQGHLSGIARTIADQGLDVDRFILDVPLDDDFFTRRSVRVIPRVDWATDQVQSVNVALRYDGTTQNVVFDATNGTAEQEVDWPSSLEDGRMRDGVEVSSEITFATAATGRPRSVRTPVETIRGDVVEISPRSEVPYEIRWVAFNVVDLPWDVYTSVEVQCRYADAEHGIDIRNDYGLTGQANSGAWPVFALDPAKRTVQYRLILHGIDGRDWDLGWAETDDDQIRIADPFQTRLAVDVAVPTSFLGTQIDRAFVDVWYDDAANDVHKRESYEISAAAPESRRFAVELVDPARREVHFTVTMILADGTVVEVPESVTNLPRIIVTPQMRGHRAVRFSAVAADLAAAGIAGVRVEARYVREAAGLSFTDDETLTPAQPAMTFEYDLANGNDDAFEYRTTHQYANGLTRDSGWLTSSSTEIAVPAN